MALNGDMLLSSLIFVDKFSSRKGGNDMKVKNAMSLSFVVNSIVPLEEPWVCMGVTASLFSKLIDVDSCQNVIKDF